MKNTNNDMEEKMKNENINQPVDNVEIEEAKYKVFQERAKHVSNKYKDETPDEWGKSYSFFATAIMFLIFSILFIIINKPNLVFMILVLMINFLFTTYKILLFSNQKIYIYSTKLVYYYGLFNTKVKTFYYGSEDMNAIKSGIKAGILKKYLDFDNCYIINSRNLGFKLENINAPDEFLEFVTMKVYNFHKEIDPDYVIPERKIITSTGTYIDNTDITKQ